MRYFLFLIPMILLGSSCAIDTEQSLNTSVQRPDIVTPAVETVTIGGQWESLDHSIDYMEYFFEENSLAQLHLYRMPQHISMRMEHNEKHPLSISNWSMAFPEALFVFNGVYFSEDFFPSGYVALNGKQLGERAFEKKYAGIITFDNGVKLFDGAVDPIELGDAKNSVQSHPVLISHGAGNILSDDGDRARRTFIGQDQDGNLYIGVVPRKTITLFELMTLLQSLPIEWDTVINLDGGSSTGMSVHIGSHTQTFNSYAAIPNVFVIEKK